MMIISAKEIEDLGISPKTCVEWVIRSFMMKDSAQLPAKISVHPVNNDFFTTMPCLLPSDIKRFGVKIVSRILGREPALKSDLLLYDSSNGDLLALLSADWITSMRTGATAALAIKTFRRSKVSKYSFIGLGATAKATVKCLLDYFPDEYFNICLFRYKEQAEQFTSYFGKNNRVSFSIVDTMEDLLKDAGVLVSCITEAHELLVKDDSLFEPGILVVPVHTRGFQNCDLFFDKVYADDTDHVKGFRYFSAFHYFDEISNVIAQKSVGRENDFERILSYNIGLGLHDAYFASHVYDMINTESRGKYL